MQFDHSDKLLTDAFAVIAKYDPALFARMSADDWRVSTDYYALGTPALFPPTAIRASEAFGMTFSADDLVWWGEEDTTPRVFINALEVRDGASQVRAPLEMFGADVLAHEYRHIHQPSAGDLEPPAFAAGSAFATKLPAPYGARIKALSDKTLAYTRGP